MKHKELYNFGIQNPITGNKQINEVATMPETKNKPANTLRAGALSVTVWENTNKNAKGEEFTNTSFVVKRGYKKEGEDDWKETDNLRLNDVPKIISLLQKAYDEVISKPKEKVEE